MSNIKLNNTNGADPLVTFVLFAYNQEKYIHEAIESALAQTYSPIEIILSDDSSTDGTFEIMQKIATEYHGNNTVIARRNTSNLRLEEHINTVCSLAKGDWIVMAAGDDISEPNRVSEIVKVIKQYPEVTAIASDLIGINSDGIITDTEEKVYGNEDIVSLFDMSDTITRNAILAHGATAAYSKKLFTDFAPLPPNSVYEDLILSFRSVLIGKRAHIHRSLVKYRNHEHQTTNFRTGTVKENDIKRQRLYYGSYITRLQCLDDYYHIFGRNKNDNVKKWIEEFIKYNSLRYKAITWIWPFKILPYYLSRFQNRKEISLSLDTKARIFLPTPLYFLLKNMQNKDI